MSEDGLKQSLKLLADYRARFEKHITAAREVRSILKDRQTDFKQEDLIEAVYLLLGLVEIQFETVQEAQAMAERIRKAMKDDDSK